ncbi:Guanylate cyclase, partial [Gryllus bimaculatus]
MEIGFDSSYPTCSGVTAPGLAADMHFKDNVVAFIGPACAFALEPVARLAAYWNTPIITGMGDQPPSEEVLSVTPGFLGRLQEGTNATGIFKDKSNYPTLTRMSYCPCRLKLVFNSIFEQFGWRHVALILDRSDLFSLTVARNLEQGLRTVLAFVRELDSAADHGHPLEHYLRDARACHAAIAHPERPRAAGEEVHDHGLPHGHDGRGVDLSGRRDLP